MKFRIVRDNFAGYELQFKGWWPFWLQCDRYGGGWGTNSSRTPEGAEELAKLFLERRAKRIASGRLIKQFEVTGETS